MCCDVLCCDVCKVGDRERQVAERFYLKQYISEWVESRGSEEERRRFEQVHPRYATLADSETDAHTKSSTSIILLPPSLLYTAAHNMPLEIMLPSQPSASALKNSLLCIQSSQYYM